MMKDRTDNTLKCDHLTSLGLKGLNSRYLDCSATEVVGWMDGLCMSPSSSAWQHDTGRPLYVGVKEVGDNTLFTSSTCCRCC